MTKQEMFDKAFIGLHSQGFRQAINGLTCSYLCPDGRRCAWGWVDPEGTVGADGRARPGGIWSLLNGGYGIAAKLDAGPGGTLEFAEELQGVHDRSSSPEDMQRSLVKFAEKHQLTVPSL